MKLIKLSNYSIGWHAALVLAMLFLPICPLLAQQRPFSDISGRSDTYVPVSVEASSLFKRTPEKMDYARGRATITIPLYEIRTSSFTLPITLSYTTGGIKVTQPNGAVAVGWTLNAEPMITREVRGLRDEQAYLTDSAYNATNPLQYQTLVGEGLKDILPDLFYYRTLDNSGRFSLSMANNYRFHPQLLSLSCVKLATPNNVVAGFFQNEISLTDNSGTVYRYGSDAASREFSDLPNDMATITTWKASSITSLNGEKMFFSYLSNFYREKNYADYDYYAVEEDPSLLKSVPPGVPPTPGYWKGTGTKENYYYYDHNTRDFRRWMEVIDRPYTTYYREVDTRFISRISFQNGSVEFGYDNVSKRLSSLTVKDSQGKQLRKITFCLSDIGYERQLLDSILIQDSQSTTCQKYEFTYQKGGSYSPYTTSVDRWGYYNGRGGNSDRIPQRQIKVKDRANNIEYPVTIGGAVNVDPELSCASLYSLASVRYPTGGQTFYNYELNTFNQYPRPGDGATAGIRKGSGLRISRIVDFPDGRQGERIVRDFTYYNTTGYGLSSHGVIRYPDASWAFEDKIKKRYFTYAGPLNLMKIDHDYTVYSNTCKLTGDNTVYYCKVTESVNGQKIDHFHEQSKGIFYSSSLYDPEYSGIEEFVNHYHEPYWNSDYLSAGGTDSYYTNDVLTEENSSAISYQAPYLTELKRKMQVVKLADIAPSFTSVDDSYRESFQTRTLTAIAMEDASPGNYHTYHTPQGEQTASDILSYTWGTGNYSRYRMVDKKTVTATDGKKYITQYKYPYSFSGPVYTYMLQKEAINTPIEEYRYLGDELKKVVKYDYVLDAATNAGFSLSAIRESTDEACTSFRTVESYSDYLPSGVPLQVVRRDGSTVCFLWSYNCQYVVAVIENATSAQVRHALRFSPEILATLSLPDEYSFNELEGLRDKLPDARVSVYRHAPLQGVTRVTGPDNRSLYNEFDRLGRLFRQRDTNEDILREYEYNEVTK